MIVVGAKDAPVIWFFKVIVLLFRCFSFITSNRILVWSSPINLTIWHRCPRAATIASVMICDIAAVTCLSRISQSGRNAWRGLALRISKDRSNTASGDSAPRPVSQSSSFSHIYYTNTELCRKKTGGDRTCG
jgi:hypothetical protein